MTTIARTPTVEVYCHHVNTPLGMTIVNQWCYTYLYCVSQNMYLRKPVYCLVIRLRYHRVGTQSCAMGERSHELQAQIS